MSPNTMSECALAEVLAQHIRDSKEELAQRWLDRIAEHVDIEPNKVFPTEQLLDHVPLLMEGIADYIEDPANEVAADTVVVTKAMELGALRHEQGFDVYQILKEYELLGGILFTHLANTADEIADGCAKGDLLLCGQRLFKAVLLIQQSTTLHFLSLADEKIAEREERLRAFNRSVSHEIKNQIGTLLGASETLLTIPIDHVAQRQQFLEIIARNARLMQHTIENLVALSRTDSDARQHHHVLLAVAAREAARQLRESAQGAHVEIRLGHLPDVEVNAAAVELCLTNYLSNAIKYADPAKSDRYAEISGNVESSPEGGREVVVRVRDNGLGVPPEKRERLYQRFFRAHDATMTAAEGTG